MDGLNVEVFGNIAVLNNLEKVSEEIRARAQAKLEEAGQFALERANELVPVATGYLKSRNQLQVRPGRIIVSNDAPYSVFVELGTSKMRPQPFLVPAQIEAGQKLKDELRGLL